MDVMWRTELGVKGMTDDQGNQGGGDTCRKV